MQSTPTRESWFTLHSITDQDRTVMTAFRAMVEPNKGKLRGTAARAPFDAAMSGIIAPQGVKFREDRIGEIPGWWCEPADALPGVAILHLHGGWFNLGSATAYDTLWDISRAAPARPRLSWTTASRRSIRFRLPLRMPEPVSAVSRNEASKESP